KAKSLNASQTAKMDLVIKKLGLKSGDSVLDIGCGWGGFSKYAAEKHGIKMHGLSISTSQIKYAEKLCEGLDCTFKFGDYRKLAEIYPQKFDAITIIGVTEHIGYKNYKGLYEVMRKRLKPGGLVLQHTITHMASRLHTEPFIERYIFPGGMVPSMAQLSEAMKQSFVLEDVHNFSADYDTTLMAWHENFARARPKIEEMTHLGERFYRIWAFYLLSCAGMFRARKAQLMQFVLSPNGVEGGYRRIS
ncbi:MAG: class I SAM-dependent methyltransferase, partial [Arenicellales bacterium]